MSLILSLIFLSFQNSHDPEIVKLVSRYDTCWMNRDIEGIMDLFTEDAVLIPHHGTPPVEGKSAIRTFWFPEDTFPGKVSLLRSGIDDMLMVSENSALVRGRFELVFEWEGKSYRNEGNYVMHCEKNQEWKIKWRIWNDPVPQTDP